MSWIGVDLDGTLAEYDGWKGSHIIGKPIPLMVQRVKQWLALGQEVRIFTARVSQNGKYSPESQRYADSKFVNEQRKLIQAWCQQNLGQVLAITNEKDFDMSELWDDRAVAVIKNTGRGCMGKDGKFIEL